MGGWSKPRFPFVDHIPLSKSIDRLTEERQQHFSTIILPKMVIYWQVATTINPNVSYQNTRSIWIFLFHAVRFFLLNLCSSGQTLDKVEMLHFRNIPCAPSPLIYPRRLKMISVKRLSIFYRFVSHKTTRISSFIDIRTSADLAKNAVIGLGLRRVKIIYSFETMICNNCVQEFRENN